MSVYVDEKGMIRITSDDPGIVWDSVVGWYDEAGEEN